MNHAENIPISSIRMDGGTQPRAAIDFAAVFDYMDAMTDGAKFPPVVVFHDGTNYWLADGFHRVKAADQAGRDAITCQVHQGTQEDAQWYSFAANKTNGLRRTNDDKHRAVQAALKHPRGVGQSDSQIAHHVGVDHKTVGAWRAKLESTWEIPKSPNRKGRDGRAINTGKIGAKVAIQPSVRSKATEGANPDPQPDPAVRLATYWCQRIWSASSEIVGCPVPAKDLAAAICRDHNNYLREHLEKTRDILTAILAEAAVD